MPYANGIVIFAGSPTSLFLFGLRTHQKLIIMLDQMSEGNGEKKWDHIFSVFRF